MCNNFVFYFPFLWFIKFFSPSSDVCALSWRELGKQKVINVAWTFMGLTIDLDALILMAWRTFLRRFVGHSCVWLLHYLLLVFKVSKMEADLLSLDTELSSVYGLTGRRGGGEKNKSHK